MISVRVDIDTIKDAKMIQLTLELLEKYKIKASFFVTTGVDETYKNYRHYLNPLKFFSGNVIKRYGMSMFSGIFTKKEVQNTKELEMILEFGHELGIHGYNHYEWMNNIKNKNKEEIISWISKGCELFEKAFGFYPKCFASPGFKKSVEFLEALDDFKFKYSGDFIGTKAFYPEINGVNLKTLQIPVSLAIGEYEDNKALKLLNEQISNRYCVFYFHPSYEPLFRKELLEKAFNSIKHNL